MAKAPSALAQDVIWRLEALGFDVLSVALRALPVDWVSAAGGGLFRLLGPLTSAHAVARRNLRLAFPEIGDAERRRLLSAQWENVGRLFAEFPLTDRLTLASGRVEMIGAEHLAAIAASGRPAVYVSGHFSNWEIGAQAPLSTGRPCEITYREANNPYIDSRIKRSRFRYGIRLFAPKGGDGARRLLAALYGGVSVALLNDQRYDEGVAAPFFGRRVHTLPAAVRLALRFGAVLQPVSVQRLKGARFRCIAHAPIVLRDSGDRAADIEAGVAAINAFIEACVRERPEEWFWVHRRWPAAAYAELAAQGL
jgi:KDO2-lipid IV(A) lauroyltransferase